MFGFNIFIQVDLPLLKYFCERNRFVSACAHCVLSIFHLAIFPSKATKRKPKYPTERFCRRLLQFSFLQTCKRTKFYHQTTTGKIREICSQSQDFHLSRRSGVP